VVRVAVRDAELAAALHVERPLHAARLEGSLLAAHRARVTATERVREAILARRLLLMAQPIVPNRAGLAPPGRDVEVLTRLVDAAGVIIPPVEFLPAVAAAGLAVDLDRAVVSTVFDWVVRNPRALQLTAKCAINLSATSLSDPAFPGFVRAELAARALPAQRLAFEITESSELLNPTQAAGTLAQLRAMGFRVALDDFGTGLSTFDYLKKLPVDYIKIDGSFIRDVEHDPVDAEIVAAIVRVAARCGLVTVAEYVSSQSLRQRVTELGVDYSRGYAVGEPISLENALS
jgi:EAL domain-containing protein (putative c-di-GMP-specific phosphodiesterase class I)